MVYWILLVSSGVDGILDTTCKFRGGWYIGYYLSVPGWMVYWILLVSSGVDGILDTTCKFRGVWYIRYYL